MRFRNFQDFSFSFSQDGQISAADQTNGSTSPNSIPYIWFNQVTVPDRGFKISTKRLVIW